LTIDLGNPSVETFQGIKQYWQSDTDTMEDIIVRAAKDGHIVIIPKRLKSRWKEMFQTPLKGFA
jgi:hypothetical protein